MDVGISAPHTAGVCLHITALPGRYGIGELGDNAKRFILSLEVMELGMWQVLPTGPTGYGDSPYQLQSTFAGNELLIDIEDLLREGWLREDDVEELAELPADSVDFGRLIPLKTAALRVAADRFLAGAPAEDRAAYNAFVAQHDARWLHDYALYRVLKRRFDERAWYEWPEQYAKRDADALRALEQDAAADINAVKVLQFFFDQQWARLRTYASKHGVQLLGDLPFYIAYDSADSWARPELLLLDDSGRPTEVAGVPPDYFSADGQLWGNPVYDWETHAAEGFAWWIDRIGHALQLTDQVRIDHFRGFESYWSVPAGSKTARDGRWVKSPGVELFEALREALGELPIVAEDLGEITDEVDELRDRYCLPGMKVLQFEIERPDFDVLKIGARNICYTGTHDNDTTRGWFEGGSADVRSPDEVADTRKKVLAITQGSADTVHLDLLKLALKSPARVVIAPVQDLLGLGSDARFNIPGSTEGNWRWRLTPEAMSPDVYEETRNLVRETRRAALTVQVPG